MSPHRLPYKAYKMLLYLHKAYKMLLYLHKAYKMLQAAVSTQSVQDAAVSTQSVQDAAVSTQSVQDAAVSTQSVQDAAVQDTAVHKAYKMLLYLHKAYKILLYLHERNRRTWASSVCYVMYRYGFDEVWKNQGVGDEKKKDFKEFRDKQLTLYKQEWATNLRTNDRFSFYNTFKSNLPLSPYLKDLKHIQARHYLIRIRLGVSP